VKDVVRASTSKDATEKQLFVIIGSNFCRPVVRQSRSHHIRIAKPAALGSFTQMEKANHGQRHSKVQGDEACGAAC
jgi:hypothetical protein